MFNWIFHETKQYLKLSNFVDLYFIIIIIIIMSCRQHGYHWPSLATSPYHSSPPAGLQGYILCPHIVAVCKFELVVLLLYGHMWGSIGVHHLWARPWLIFTNHIYLTYMYQPDSALDNLQWLICHKTKPNQSNYQITLSHFLLYSFHLVIISFYLIFRIFH